MIQAQHLSKQFEVEKGLLHAVNDVSFTVTDGEIYGIIGLSGAGKSTLVRLLNRLEEPTSGTVIIDGVDVMALQKKELLEMRKEIGMIFQTFNLFAQKTIRKNISYPMEIAGWSHSKIASRTEELLQFIGLEDRGNAYPSELSGGQKQRVAIARAMALQPKILLSDEGTSALDPKNTQSILQLLRQLSETYGTTIIMITHQMEVAKEICDRIAVMADGQIVEENTTAEIFFHPKHSITKAFISRLQESEETVPVEMESVDGQVIKLTFRDEKAQKGIIFDIAKKYDVGVSILAANINTFQKKQMGTTILELTGSPEAQNRALEAFRSELDVEVLQ